MEKRTLICTLTPEEFNQRSAELSRSVKDWGSTNEEKKAATKDFNDRIKELESNMNRLSRIVTSRKEEREIEIEWIPYPSSETMRLFRKDTGEELSSRPMSREEKDLFCQIPLPLPKQPIAPPPPVAVFGLPPAAMPIVPEPPPPAPLGLPPANYIAPAAPAPVLQLETKEEIPEADFEVVSQAPAAPTEPIQEPPQQ